MSTNRTDAARDAGLLPAGHGLRVLVFGTRADSPLCAAYPGARFVQPFQPDHDRMAAAGLDVGPEPPGGAGAFDLAVIALPRARALAQAWIAAAAAQLAPGGLLAVDGAKTDGVDSLYRALRGRLSGAETLTKAHGRIFAGGVGTDRLGDLAPGETWAAPGFCTAPGVFSADGIDPGSAALAAALPAGLGAQVADLGAGWGWLSAQILGRADIDQLHMVEADFAALQAARANVTDPRATAHWADATAWEAPAPLDAVVMNPPFHTGRAADPALGQAFIATAARLLAPRGSLWMVSNRHLPYESTLDAQFAEWRTVDTVTGFKILHASRPRKPRNGARQ
jgi:16S rRNA (guanine1207-N2)-methyltransferase